MSRKEAEKQENREVLEVIIDVIRHLSMQNVALRGHDEGVGSTNRGNFLEEVEFIAKYHPPLRKWLDTHPGNVNWLSHEIQNELLDLLRGNIIAEIKCEIDKCGHFSVQADEVTSHHHSYMSVIMRYVYQGEIKERLVALKKVVSLKGKSLCEILLSVIDSLGLDMK